MEEIYMNVEYDKSVHSRPSTNQTGPRNSDTRFYGVIILSLGLLSVFLLAGLIGLSVHYHNSVRGAAAELSTMKANLTDLLKASKKLSFLTEERDLLKANLTEITAERDLLKSNLSQMTEERNRLQKLSRQKKTCPVGWTMFSCSCYFLSNQTGSWTYGRQDCRNRGADLVVIDSAEEQTFLTGLTQKQTWIGLSDLEKEGTWKWIDGTPLTLKYWSGNQPDNGGGDPKWGEEDCAHIRTHDNTLWNDLSCSTFQQWICEKIPGV